MGSERSGEVANGHTSKDFLYKEIKLNFALRSWAVKTKGFNGKRTENRMEGVTLRKEATHPLSIHGDYIQKRVKKRVFSALSLLEVHGISHFSGSSVVSNSEVEFHC